MKSFHQFQQFAKGKVNQALQGNNNAVIYTRVSSKEQADTNQSLETQRKYCTEYGMKNNLNVLGFFGGTYESAKTDERNEFNRMIKFLKNSKEKIAFILVYSLDRFSRSGENAIYISSQLKKQGVTIVSVTQPIDVSTHAGVLQQNIQFIFSKYDNDLRMQKCVDGMREKLKRGEWLGAAPTGYSYDRTNGEKEQKIIINENGKVLQKAFQWRLEGHSNNNIVEKLKALGLTLPFQRISEIFRNPFYCGLISHNMLNGEIVDGKHPALVSKEVFLKVHQLNKKGGYKQKKENEHLPLKLFVKCEKCGSPFTGYLVKKKGIYYYKCNDRKCHCNRSVKIMHNNFVGLLNGKASDSTYKNIYKKALEYIYNKETSAGKNKQVGFASQLKEIKEKLYKTEERFACGEIDRDIYNKVSEKFKSEIMAIEESSEKSNLKLSNPEKAISFIVDLSSKLSTTWALNDYSQKQNVQKLLFPDGLRYNKENDEYLTQRWISPIAVTSYLSETLKEKKNGIPDDLSEISRLVAFPGLGTHDVKLIVTTICKKDSITKPAYITTTNCTCVMTTAASAITNASCSGANNGSAIVTINNGSGGTYSYSWSNGISGTTTAATINITGLSANTYTVTITDGSCISVSTVTVTSQNTLSINSITTGNISCNGGSNGSATVTISSSIGGPYTYKWSNGASSITNSLNNPITNLTAGTYTVSITQGSCLSTTTTTITQPQLLVIGGSTLYSCLTNSGNTNTFSVNGTSPYSYLWSNGQTTSNATGLNLGTTYTVTATDASGCTATKAFIPVISPMVMTTTSTNNSCTTTGSASVTVTSGVSPYAYNWSTGQTNSSVGGLLAGGYTATITDGNGCTQTKTFSITGVNPVSATFTNPPACAGQQVCFTNTGSVGTYAWTIGAPANVSGTTANFCFTFLTAGTYSVSHTVTNAGCTGNVTQNINVTPCGSGPTVTATGSSICYGSCTSITSSGSGGTGPYTYSWSNGATTQNINPCPLSTTIYTITIKDSGGNTSSSTAIVTINPIVTATTTFSNIACSGGTGSASALGGSGTIPYAYNWSNGQTTQTITGLSQGIYTVTITDNKGCTGTSTAALASPPVLTGQFAKGTANCTSCGCKEWVIITASGGTSPYSYSWPDGYVNRYKNQLCPGNYTVNIKDKNGCSVNISITAP